MLDELKKGTHTGGIIKEPPPRPTISQSEHTSAPGAPPGANPPNNGLNSENNEDSVEGSEMNGTTIDYTMQPTFKDPTFTQPP